MKKIKCLLLSPVDIPKSIEVDSENIEELQKIIDCRCFTMVRRTIGGKEYDLWIDDEGLFKQEEDGTILASGICSNAYEILAGNILIANNKGDEMDSLNEEDFMTIMDNLVCFSKDTNIGYDTNIGHCEMLFKKEGVILRYEV